MDVKKAIHERRAYRSLKPVKITEQLVEDLAESAQLAPSCFNNQPWRFVFVYEPKALETVKACLSKGNEWAKASSMIIAVFSKEKQDCVIEPRKYYWFDTGMAVGFILLRATELGLVAHPIAGYDEAQVKKVLNIPDDMMVITLINVGKHSETISPVLSDQQKASEMKRPERLPLEKFAYKNTFTQ
jgi:nitroreductase